MRRTAAFRNRVQTPLSPHWFRPQIEQLESRQQPGETFGFGFLGGALAGTSLDLVSLPLGATASEQAFVRGHNPLRIQDLAEETTPASWLDPTNEDTGGTVVNHQALPALIQPTARAQDFGADLEELPRLPLMFHPSYHASLSGLAAPGNGAATAAAGNAFPERATPLPGIAFHALTEPASLSSLVPPGLTSQRLAPNSASFDPWSSTLFIRGDGAGHTMQEAFTPSGFLELTLDGQPHSSDPASAAFDPLLSGATSGRVTGIQLDNGKQDTLFVGPQQLAGGLTVNAPGATVVTQDVRGGGPLVIQAGDITVHGALRGNAVTLAATDWVNVEDAGRVVAGRGDTGGSISISADKLANTGQLHADGPTGGQLIAEARNILHAGAITADGTNRGGTVQISFTGAYIDTAAALTSANGGDSGPAGHVVISGGSTGHLFTSGRQQATGSVGGTIDLLGREVVLDGGAVDVSGESGGGSIRVGGDFHGDNAAVANADTVTVTAAATLQADARSQGNGGRVRVWANHATTFAGSVSARGGAAGGSGGLVEVSSGGTLIYGGAADTGAAAGRAGTLLLDPKNLIVSAVAPNGPPQFDFIDPHPSGRGMFGSTVEVLSNGNIVVNNPTDDFGGSNAGAMYLLNGLTGTLISALVGNSAGDGVGAFGNPIPLTNGNYVAITPGWNSGRGAATWGSATTGVSGVVSVSNSLVGSSPSDLVGYGGVTALANGNYVVNSLDWSGGVFNGLGAVTWGDGSMGVTGAVSTVNSLVGANPGDHIGGLAGFPNGVTALPNGNYVVASPSWNSGRGAVTWGNGGAGSRGTVSATNSLVGGSAGDHVGSNRFADTGVTVMANGNYVVSSTDWGGDGGSDTGLGAVTWGSGTAGVSGTISAANSLVGTNPHDNVGVRVIALANGNYVVASPYWNGGLDGGRGAATWGSGMAGAHGTVSSTNSLVGTNPGDHVSLGGVAALANGNYVVASPDWTGGVDRGLGAATWASGTAGATGTISSTNSLVGTNPGDHVSLGGVTALANGNYVVASPGWNGGRGAVTWSSGAAGITGDPSATNSLIGANSYDQVGSDGNGGPGVTALTNGNYVVASPNWMASRGAVTWGSGSAGVVGVVSATNSLVGSSPLDHVGGLRGGPSGVTLLPNGSYVVVSPSWNAMTGAVTWGDGTVGVRGAVSASNSLVGAHGGDFLGEFSLHQSGVFLLRNGNYVVASPNWGSNGGVDTGIGAVTWGSGTAGARGTVSAANSLVGDWPGVRLGANGVTALANGNYVVAGALWNGGSGWATWASGISGRTLDGINHISPENSLFGNVITIYPVVLDDPSHQAFLVIFAQEGTGRVTSAFADLNQFTFSRDQTQTVTIRANLLERTLGTGTAVVLQASNDITINSPIRVSAGGHGGTLTLQAGRSILLNASITTDNGPLTLIANDTRADGVVDSQRDPGNATIVMAGGTTLDTGTALLDIELRDGAGLTHADSRAINLQTLTAGSVRVVNAGPDAGSDIRLGAVTTSGPQSYRDLHGVTSVTADLTTADAPITFSDSVAINDDVNVNTGSGTVNFAGAGTQTLQTGAGVTFADVNHTGSGTLQLTTALTLTGTLLQSAGTFDANDQPVTVAGAVVVTGGTYLAGTAPQTFAGGLVLANGTFTSATGAMAVHGGVTLTGGTFGGEGSVDQLTVYGGTVAPGTDTPGVLRVAGAVTLNPLTTFRVLLDRSHAGRGYAQLRTAGPVNLGGSTLQLVPGFEPPLGRAFKILTAATAGDIQGTFAGLPEGALFDQAGFQFQITYQGGARGRDVVLTRIA